MIVRCIREWRNSRGGSDGDAAHEIRFGRHSTTQAHPLVQFRRDLRFFLPFAFSDHFIAIRGAHGIVVRELSQLPPAFFKICFNNFELAFWLSVSIFFFSLLLFLARSTTVLTASFVRTSIHPSRRSTCFAWANEFLSDTNWRAHRAI